MTYLSSTKDNLFSFFGLTFLLSVPFYILNTLAYLHILGEPAMGAMYIALFTITPIASASILKYRKNGSHGLKNLLKRIFDFHRIADKRWYFAILLLSPFLYCLSLGGFIFTGAHLPPAMISLVMLPGVFLFFFLLATAEEIGWMGYAFKPMLTKFGALKAALLLGVIWALWHLPFFVFMMKDPVVLITQMLTLVGMRILIAWIFIHTERSVFAAILVHAVDNTALVIMPEFKAVIPWGSVFLCGAVWFAVIIVTLLWGGRTMNDFRFRNENR